MARMPLVTRPHWLSAAALVAFALACSDSKPEAAARPTSRARDKTASTSTQKPDPDPDLARAGTGGDMRADVADGGRAVEPRDAGSDGASSDDDSGTATPDKPPVVDPPPRTQCQPTAGGPYSVLEQEELTVEVKCA